MMSLKFIFDTNWPNNNWISGRGEEGGVGGGGGGEEDLKICLVITMSAEALQSDLVKIFPNFQNYT